MHYVRDLFLLLDSRDYDARGLDVLVEVEGYHVFQQVGFHVFLEVQEEFFAEVVVDARQGPWLVLFLHATFFFLVS